LWIHSKLDVRPAGLNADFANDGNRRIAHRLVLAVGECLCRGDGNRVAGVYAHRVEVLDRADNDNVVRQVAHQLEFVFLPPKS
jgi:hypothetical protein